MRQQVRFQLSSYEKSKTVTHDPERIVATDDVVVQFPNTRTLADDGDLDDAPVLVDQHLLEPDVPPDERRPIIPPQIRRENLRQTGRNWYEIASYRVAFHALRIPKYLILGVLWSVVGVFKLAGEQLRWWWLTEATPLRLAAVENNDPIEYRDQLKQTRGVRGFRGYMLLVEVLAVLGLIVWLGAFAPRWATGLTLVAAVPMLAHLGRPADRPIITRAVIPTQIQPLTSEHVIRALSRLGLTGINQAVKDNPNAIGFPAPVREDGPGWRADVDLPPGVTAAEVIERRDRYASALGRPLGCVWPEADPEVSPARLVTWVGKVDIAKARQPAWPLLRSGTVDLFKPIPFGTDQRGRTVTALMLRVLPPTDGDLYVVLENDRLDLIADRSYGDGTRFWRIADANSELDARSLIEPGRDIDLPPTK
jgi:S-DNA-T family DNA segregation ATPase FtsK/SpoIIIE